MNNKDWTGNSRSTYSALAASSHSKSEREINDYYATNPKMAEELYNFLLKQDNIELNNVWEPVCGEGHLAKFFENKNKLLLATDLIDRGYHSSTCGEQYNFLNITFKEKYKGDIITNPPYKYALEFVKKSLDIIESQRYICMFLKIQFLEGKNRRKLFDEQPPKYVLVSTSRTECAKNGISVNGLWTASAVCFAWFIWQKDYKGDTIVKWFN